MTTATKSQSFSASTDSSSSFFRIWRKIFGLKSEWTTFEKIWLILFTIANLVPFFLLGDSPIGLIASLSGMLCVVLVAKGKISNYAFGVVQAALYGYVSFTYSLYGEVALNWLFYLPMQFVGFYLWRKNSRRVTDGKIESHIVEAKSLKLRTLLLGSIVLGILVWIFSTLLIAVGGSSTGLDAATTVLSITAQFLMIYRFAEQWLLWILVNVLSITMWIVTLSSSGGDDWSMVVMWSAFLVNSIYGYINWKKLARKSA